MARIKTLDLAKGFTVLFIAPIHTMLLLSKPELQTSVVGYIFQFIAEGPGAQLLMLLMGVSFYLSPPKSFVKVFEKCLSFLLMGYFLNIWKFVMPTIFDLLPKQLLQYLEYKQTSNGLIKLAAIGDILQFAGIAYFILYLVSKISKHHAFYLCLAAIICFIAPAFWDLHSTEQLSNYFLQLSGGQPPFVFFPLFPWIVYPLVGMGIGYFVKDGSSIFSLLPIGIAFLAFGFILSRYFIPCDETSFYRTCPGNTIFHLGIVLTWISLWDLVASKAPDNLFFIILKYLSKHITLVYFVQWVLIAWVLPVVGYQVLNAKLSFIAIVVVEFNVIGFTFIITQLLKKPT